MSTTSWVLALLSLGLLLVGCGGPPRAARTTIAAAAVAVAAADVAAEPFHRAKTAACLEENDTAEGYVECTAKVDTLATTIIGAHRGLLATEAALDAWDVGADDGTSFLSTLPCLTQMLGNIAILMEDLGLEIAPELLQAIGLANALGGRCEP